MVIPFDFAIDLNGMIKDLESLTNPSNRME